jgi:hypothetical protein
MINMGLITISLDDKSEKRLRDCAKIIYGEKKGSLSKTIMLGINKLENKRDNEIKDALEILENPIDIDKKYKNKKLPTREQLYSKISRKILK